MPVGSGQWPGPIWLEPRQRFLGINQIIVYIFDYYKRDSKTRYQNVFLLRAARLRPARAARPRRAPGAAGSSRRARTCTAGSFQNVCSGEPAGRLPQADSADGGAGHCAQRPQVPQVGDDLAERRLVLEGGQLAPRPRPGNLPGHLPGRVPRGARPDDDGRTPGTTRSAGGSSLRSHASRCSVPVTRIRRPSLSAVRPVDTRTRV